MDMSQYRTLFITESREYVKSIGEMVVALEEAPQDRGKIDALFRAAHSLKGMAASMDYAPVVMVAHAMENLMVRVRDEGLPFDAGVGDLLLEGADLMGGMLRDLEKDSEMRPAGDLPQRLADYTGGPAAPPPAPQAKEEPPPEGAAELSTVRVSTELLDRLINLTGELIANKHRLLTVSEEVASPPLSEAIGETSKLLRRLHDDVMQVRLIPFDAICERFQRAMRDIAKKSGKEVHFELRGRDISLDRGILEQLIDPLNHLLRNAVDHGVEGKEERLAAGKAARGVVTLSVQRDRERVVITVSDDGRGIDPEALTASALKKGLITAEEAQHLSPRQALMLSVIPGFSTAKQVTELSGRGVGMDVVNASIQRLGGTLSIESEPGAGSKMTLLLPMTIATIHALVVTCGEMKVAIPVNTVQRTVELHRDEIETIGKRQVFYLGEEPVPLLSLNRSLGLPLGRFPDGIVPLFVSEAKGRRVGLVVDRLLGQAELFLKPLGRPLSRLKGVAGGATLGDGEVITVLDVADLL
ncbi:chemotaxis protein CheA [Geomonas sp. RF6]|uniref:chemotaxis protein CheA n=1 Tax=Geomonas sp. RF6 TaxID=2897342 RepID=UPI001E46E44C|nr:chemotaxis protein CheA [Geomonas sp. RF6]UFS71567.1 chemotaxis protein CheA [Geomonas sp. RF6]